MQARLKADRFPLPLAIALVLFLVGAPLFVDTYNTLNQRAFLDLMLRGNPYSLAPQEIVRFRSYSWPLDWPYPPLTILFDLPAWAAYRLTHSEALYQFLFKLPLFMSAVGTVVLLRGSTRHQGRSRSSVTLVYLLLPPVVLLTTIVGGFDVVAAFLVLLSYYCYLRKSEKWSAIALGLATALRLYPIVLLPIYLIHLFRDRASVYRLFLFGLAATAPLVLTCLPFVVLDPGGFAQTLNSRQLQFGPFAALNVFAPVVCAAAASASASREAACISVLGLGFLVPTLWSLLSLYLWIHRNSGNLVRDILLALLVLFLFYPKVHALYTVALLPLALVYNSRFPQLVWIPGVAWMLSVNGLLGATGILYLIAPLTGEWNQLLPDSLSQFVTAGLAALQAAIVLVSLVDIFRKHRLWASRSGAHLVLQESN